MTYSGQIKNGVAVLDSSVELPDGTPVQIRIDRDGVQFWRRMTVEQVAAAQGVTPAADLTNLPPVWPEDDSIDDFLAFVRGVRK